MFTPTTLPVSSSRKYPGERASTAARSAFPSAGVCGICAVAKPARDGLKAQKSEKARAAYRQAHESDFIIADAAARYFREHGITKLPARKALQDEIEQLVSKKSSLYNTYHEQKQRYTELQTVKRNIDQILRREEPRRRKEQSHER